MGQGKNYRQRKSNSKIEVKSRISPDGESTVNGEYSNSENLLDCFQFELQEPSELVKETVIGESVFGDFSADRILILAHIGALGYAPKNISKKLLTIAQKKQVSIQGSIVQKIGNKNVEVRVCV
ncbi:MAG: hypothetical protein M3209_07600 [Acidobacteriota bacterium]|nr:hypothetical protein [Acidobacteriota bacterium]